MSTITTTTVRTVTRRSSIKLISLYPSNPTSNHSNIVNPINTNTNINNTKTINDSTDLTQLFTTLCYSPIVSSTILYRFRLFSFAYLFLVNLVSIFTWELLWLELDGDTWHFHFKYFTNWALTAATCYFAFTTILTKKYINNNNNTSAIVNNNSNSSIIFLLRSSLRCSEFSIVFSIISTILYWSVIFNPSRVFHLSHNHTILPLIKELSVHGLSMILLLLDQLLIELIYPNISLLYICFYGAIYHIFATINYYYTNQWLYSFLDWNNYNQWIPVYTLYGLMFFAIQKTQIKRNQLIRTVSGNSSKLK